MSISPETSIDPEIAKALAGIPPHIRKRSGAVFYTGPAAFRAPSSIYLMGLNPGGDPLKQSAETVEEDIKRFEERSEPWSAYQHASWRGAAAGSWGMQPRVCNLLNKLGLTPSAVPASNVVFVRSATEAKFASEKDMLLRACWPVHEAVLSALNVRAVICFGGTAGRWVRERIGAKTAIGNYVETNNRGWTSYAHRADDGRIAFTLTHPSRVDWINPDADPSIFVRDILQL